MRIAKRPAELGFNRYDGPRLKKALKRVTDKRLFQRVQAVLWVAQGHAISEVAELTSVSGQTIYNWLKLYLERHHVATLANAPRSGRPLAAPRITAARILYHLRRNPLRLGYQTTVWSVKLLAAHLSRQYHCPITPYTLRRRMKAMGLRCKRPRYFYEEKAPPPGTKKGAIVRRLKHLPANAVLLFADETVLRLFPVLRRAWALCGEQAKVAITGRNAKRVLFGAINLRTGHRLVLRRPNMRQEHFQVFLRLVRQAYPGRRIGLLLDEAPSHLAAKSQALAARLGIVLLWLPKQCAELNAMDQLWRELKSHISANYQYPTIDDHAAAAEEWIMALTPTEALRKAGVLSHNFWVKSFIK